MKAERVGKCSNDFFFLLQKKKSNAWGKILINVDCNILTIWQRSPIRKMKKTITYFIFHHEFDEMGELSIMGNYFDVNFRRKYVKQIRRGVACEIAQKFEEWYKKNVLLKREASLTSNLKNEYLAKVFFTTFKLNLFIWLHQPWNMKAKHFVDI